VPWPVGHRLGMFWAGLFNWMAVLLCAVPALVLLVLRWREVCGSPLALPALMLAGLLLTAAVYNGEPRFRIACDGILAILAGKAWWSISPPNRRAGIEVE